MVSGVGNGVERDYVGKACESGGGVDCERSTDVVLEGAVVDGGVG